MLSHFDDKVAESAANLRKRLPAPMKSKVLDSVDQISTISFLLAFKLACDTNGVHEGAHDECYSFHGAPAAGAPKVRFAVRSKSQKRQKQLKVRSQGELLIIA